jgi:hypothetical protein
VLAATTVAELAAGNGRVGKIVFIGGLATKNFFVEPLGDMDMVTLGYPKNDT